MGAPEAPAPGPAPTPQLGPVLESLPDAPAQDISKEDGKESEASDSDRALSPKPPSPRLLSRAASPVSPREDEDMGVHNADEKPEATVPESPPSLPAVAVRDVEVKAAEIQVEISESTVSVQTDLSFMLAAMMSKKPGSQRAIEDFARQTLEEFGLGQKWGSSTLGKADFQVTKPALLATQPTVPDAPPTVLKTKEDPRRANALSQSTGFGLSKSGPYFLRGKGSQRVPAAKGRALYDVVPP